MKLPSFSVLLFLLSSGSQATPAPLTNRDSSDCDQALMQCKKTEVVILGAGIAGITAAQALSNNSVTDFLIVEYNPQIGGRCNHAEFGNDTNGNPYIVELGNTWVVPGSGNPIWTLVEKYNVANYPNNFTNVLTYDDSGEVDYAYRFYEFGAGIEIAAQDAGVILTNDLQDRDLRSGLNIAGYKPTGNPQAMAAEWYNIDYSLAQIPDVSSQVFSVVSQNATYYGSGFSDVNSYVTDQRGFNAFINGQASEFLAENDPRLLLNTIVTNITYSDSNVTIINSDGSCIVADYAITTFSVGVLQSDAITFTPKLPDWKNVAINTMQMGVYTKIFLQFRPEDVFWDTTTEFFLYADNTRGYYPAWQSLDHANFFPGSGILFVTIVTEQSIVIDLQDDDTTRAQVMDVLRTMFQNITVPEPIDFMYPRWSKTPWSYGSFSNWPPGLSLQGHQNLRTNVGRVFFAGEATSTEYFGYAHGAYFEGQNAGEEVARCLAGNCTGEVYYEVLGGVTPITAYSEENGWTAPTVDYA